MSSTKSPKTSFDIEEFYDENINNLYLFFFRRCLDKALAEDLTSDTFISFVEKINSGKRPKNPVGFLFGIAKNKFVIYLQEKYKIVNLDSEILEFSNLEKIPERDTRELEKRVKRLIKKLPASQRKVMELRFNEKLSPKEICEELGRSMSYFKTTQNRAIKSLKKLSQLEGVCKPDVINKIDEK